LRAGTATAEFEVLLVAAPDRLARKYVYKVLLSKNCRAAAVG
jgi:hypothetical protein